MDPERFARALQQFIRALIRSFSSLRHIWIIVRPAIFRPPPLGLEKAKQRIQLPFRDFKGEESSIGRHLASRGMDSFRSLGMDIKIGMCDLGAGMTAVLTVDDLHPTRDGQVLLGRNFADFIESSGVFST